VRYLSKAPFSSKHATDDYLRNHGDTFGPRESNWCTCEHRRGMHGQDGRCKACDCQALQPVME